MSKLTHLSSSFPLFVWCLICRCGLERAMEQDDAGDEEDEDDGVHTQVTFSV
jgi:hypothetical protein